MPLPRIGFNKAEMQQLLQGNAVADVTADGLGVARLSGAYSIVENPLLVSSDTHLLLVRLLPFMPCMCA